MRFRRGDTFFIKFRRRDFNNETITHISEKMWFTVKENAYTKEKLIQKTLADGNIIFDDNYYYHVIIEHDDTKDLDYGTYYCDIQVENEGVITTIYKDTFELDEEVTFEGNDIAIQKGVLMDMLKQVYNKEVSKWTKLK